MEAGIVTKIKNCLRCGVKFEPKNPKGKFCSDKCRVYWGREKVVKKEDIPEPESIPEEPKVGTPKEETLVQKLLRENREKIQSQNKN